MQFIHIFFEDSSTFLREIQFIFCKRFCFLFSYSLLFMLLFEIHFFNCISTKLLHYIQICYMISNPQTAFSVLFFHNVEFVRKYFPQHLLPTLLRKITAAHLFSIALPAYLQQFIEQGGNLQLFPISFLVLLLQLFC